MAIQMIPLPLKELSGWHVIAVEAGTTLCVLGSVSSIAIHNHSIVCAMLPPMSMMCKFLLLYLCLLCSIMMR